MTSPTRRRPIGKLLRFEVFKRDGFTCQYCGAHPPGVLLEVDHVIPVAGGGTNEIGNLITACRPCNAGKGARALSAIPQSLQEKGAEIKEREAQLRQYEAIVRSRARRLSEGAEEVATVYERFNRGYTLSEKGLATAKKFVALLGATATCEAMELAHARGTRDPFRYFCGVCWNLVREQEGCNA